MRKKNKIERKLNEAVFGKEVATAFLKIYHVDGRITNQDLKLPPRDLVQKIIDIVKADGEAKRFGYALDHRETILAQAEYFRKEGEDEYATMFYATFFEHSLNHIIKTACYKNKFDDTLFKEIVRNTDIHAKLTWCQRFLD